MNSVVDSMYDSSIDMNKLPKIILDEDAEIRRAFNFDGSLEVLLKRSDSKEMLCATFKYTKRKDL